MIDFNQAWQEILARPDGPLAMRFYLQPLMSIIFAVRDGLRDGRMQRPAYFWGLFTHPSRMEMLRSGWKSVGKIFVLASVLDVVYSLLVLHAFRPLQTVVVATALAVVPYLIVRGPVNRLAKILRGDLPSRRDAA